MTRFISINKLPKVCRGQTFDAPSRDYSVPNWTNEMCDWYRQNADKIKTVHRQKNYELDQYQFVLEFINEEEATMFALKFA